jgi:hypothetical protein
VGLGGDRDVGQDLAPGLVDAGHRPGVMVGDPQRPATGGQALGAGPGGLPGRQPVGVRVDPGHAVAAAAGIGHPDRPRRGRQVQGRPTDRDGRHPAAGGQVDAGDRVLAWRAEVPGGDAGDPQGPLANGDGLSIGRDPQGLPTTMLVRGSIPTTLLEAASTHSFPSATVMLAAPGTGMTAANRSRSKAGTVAPVPVGVGGGWVDLGVLGVSAAPEHPAAANSSQTASVRQRGRQGSGGRRVAGPAMAHLLPGLQTEHPFLPPRCRAGSLRPRLAWRTSKPDGLVAGRASVIFELPTATGSRDGRRSAH